MYTMRVYYKPSSPKTDQLIRGICYPGQLIGNDTHLPTMTRDLEFQFEFALDAAISKTLLEQNLSGLELSVEVKSDV